MAITSASATLGTVTDLRAVSKLVHDVGGLVVVDHSAAAPYRLMDINEIDADVVAVNAVAWGGPPIGALVFREPALIESFNSMSLVPYATGPARLEVGVHQFGLLAGLVASIEYLASLDESARVPGAKDWLCQCSPRESTWTGCSTTWSRRCGRCRG